MTGMASVSTTGKMPVTMVHLNMVEGIDPVLQVAEGYTVDLPTEVDKTLLDRTDPTWPSTWFAPRLTGKGAFKDVYSVMGQLGREPRGHGHTAMSARMC